MYVILCCKSDDMLIGTWHLIFLESVFISILTSSPLFLTLQFHLSSLTLSPHLTSLISSHPISIIYHLSSLTLLPHLTFLIPSHPIPSHLYYLISPLSSHLISSYLSSYSYSTWTLKSLSMNYIDIYT